ncbi:MAG: ABC transporter substrate-binding protein [Jatrophihabitans sp.]|uniref:ABC transporter substrate-binding protein n=1 Tax=Jatrophihabitans sp. TaxID=1932789 RepID=UPI003F7E16AA
MPVSSLTLRRATTLACTAALAAGLTACGGGSSSRSTTSTGGGKPVAGATLTIAAQAPPNSLDPAQVASALTAYTIPAYDSLIYRAADGSLQPDLASSWKAVGSTNQQLDVTLRSGVTFSDGAPVTADAVLASLQYAQKAPGAQAAMLVGMTFTKTGPSSITIKSATPNPMLADTFTQFTGVGQIISPKGLANPKALSASGVSHGAGPYVLDPSATVAGDHYTYTARAGYFDTDRQHYKKIVVRVIANPQSVVNALKTGQVDVAIGGDSSVLSQVTAAGLKVTSVPFVFQGLALLDRSGQVSKPLGDVRVRQAINYAIDRATVTKAVLGASGVPTVQTVVQGADGYSDTAAKQYPYDPAKAKQLLAAAGYPNGFTLPVASAQFAGIDTMAQAIQGQLAKVGIKVQLKTDTDIPTYLGDLTSKKFPAAAVGYGAQPMFQEGQGLFLPTAPVFNGFKSNDPKLTALFAKASAADPTTRAKLDQQMEEYLVDQAWFAPVAFSPVFYFSRPSLGGLQLSGKAPIATPLDWYDTK